MANNTNELQELRHYVLNTSVVLESIVKARKTNIDQKIDLLLERMINTSLDIVRLKKASDSDTYEIVLYVGEIEIGRIRITFIEIANSQTLPSIPFMAEITPANSQIQAKIATKAGGSETIDLSLAYHLH